MTGRKDENALLLILKQDSWIDLAVFLSIPDLDFISVLGNKNIQIFLMLVSDLAKLHGATLTTGIQGPRSNVIQNPLWDFNLFCDFL